MPWTWNTCLARSRPIVAICMVDGSSCDSSQRSPYGDSSPGAGAVHHIMKRLMHCTNFEKNNGTHLHGTHVPVEGAVNSIRLDRQRHSQTRVVVISQSF